MNFTDGNHRPTVDEVRNSLQQISLVDWVLFFGLMIVTSGIGFMYARRTKGSGSAAYEYLHAGDKMTVFPISMSLMASIMSSIVMVGHSAIVYMQGTAFFFGFICAVLGGLLCHFIYFPVLLSLKLPSAYKYLYIRFDDKVRWLASFCFVVSQIFRMPIVIYMPSLILHQASGVDTFVIAAIMSSICIFYTCIGGFRAVVWTDVIQTIFMFVTLLVIMVVGTYKAGGLQFVWDSAFNTNRIAFAPLAFDFTTEYSLWSIIFGATVLNISHENLNQNSIQRYNTLETPKQVKSTLIIYVLGYFTALLMASYNGLVAFAYFQGCDPLTTRLARNKNEIIPLLVMEIIGHIPGLPSLFFVGMFCASLSTLSTSLNSVPAVILEDFIKPLKKTAISDGMTVILLKIIVVLFGGLYVALVLVVEWSGSIVTVLALSLASITSAPLSGLFTAGMLLPFINSKGALWGSLSGMAVTSVIVAGNQIARVNGALYEPNLPLGAKNCTYNFPLTPTVVPQVTPDIFPLFKVCFLWNPFIGFIITLAVASVISYVTGGNDVRKMDYRYFSHHVHKWLPKQNIDAKDTLLKSLKTKE